MAGTARGWDEARLHLTALAYLLRPTLSEEQVCLFEQQYNVKLPESYRSFVTTVGDGGAGPHHGLWSLDRAYGPKDEAWRPGFLATPFPYAQTAGPDALGDDYDEDQLVTGSMIVADMGCGAFVRLVVTGVASGQVWFDTLGINSTLEQGPDFHEWYLIWLESQMR